MKNLYVVRHAKSSWSHPDLRDFDRPLNKRGKADAPRMGRFLNDQGVQPDGLVSSPAKRAFTTAELIALQLNYPVANIIPESTLYGAGVQDTLDVVRTLAPEWSTAMIFGHNPTTTAFVNWLANTEIDNVPTCGVAHVLLHADSWAQLEDAKTQLVAFFVPKELPKDS